MDQKAETHDFMNVESFSQLPFIRPSPASKEKAGTAGGGAIRLFGKEFGGNSTTTTDDNNDYNNTRSGRDHEEDEGYDNNSNYNKKADGGISSSDHNSTDMMGSSSSRKFECHYCCRNFPTSQALGGHQNAHKRERQHAKRAHLHSAMVGGGSYGGLMNYSGGRLGAPPPAPMPPYHLWNVSSSSSSSSRLYAAAGHSTTTYNNNNNNNNNNGHHHQPINGSPLAMWRIPSHHTINTTTPTPFITASSTMHQQHVPMFNTSKIHDQQQQQQLMMIKTSNFSSQLPPRPTIQDHHLSLDLHL